MKMPSHTTVVAYLSLFVAIGGSAYAVANIGSSEIKNHSVRGKDVARNTLAGAEIDESKLSGPIAAGTEQSGTCDPLPGTPVDCSDRTITLPRKSALLILATASKAAGGSGVCSMALDGFESNGQFFDAATRDGFGLTKVTSPLPSGDHSVSLRCTESSSDFRLDNPTIAAVAVTSP
jgi:hypothetical protein